MLTANIVIMDGAVIGWILHPLENHTEFSRRTYQRQAIQIERLDQEFSNLSILQ
jgi:hypothetical protein